MGERLAITGVTLVDGRGGDPLERAVVVVEDATIVAAGAESDVPRDGAAEVLDAAGATLMPGIIDAHCTSAARPTRTRTGGCWRTTGIRPSPRRPRRGRC